VIVHQFLEIPDLEVPAEIQDLGVQPECRKATEHSPSELENLLPDEGLYELGGIREGGQLLFKKIICK